ncbi:hypothetical protein [Cupriavidus necator]
MNLTRLTFEFDGHTVAVEGYHYAGYSGNVSPPEPESFSVTKAEIVKQADADEPVSVDDLDEEELADAALREWRERDEFERDLYADMRREDAWLERRAHR